MAIQLAAAAHTGQGDKGGQPYILHPLRLMLQCQTDEERIVAVLHDVVEDSDFVLDDLRSYGFSEEVISAIECLTRRPDETYEQFVERVADNPLARTVKILDLMDNMDLSRLSTVTPSDLNRKEKYKKALSFLER